MQLRKHDSTLLISEVIDTSQPIEDLLPRIYLVKFSTQLLLSIEVHDGNH